MGIGRGWGVDMVVIIDMVVITGYLGFIDIVVLVAIPYVSPALIPIPIPIIAYPPLPLPLPFPLAYPPLPLHPPPPHNTQTPPSTDASFHHNYHRNHPSRLLINYWMDGSNREEKLCGGWWGG